ncbi:MAG TPA: hypothetical protein VJN18_15685 [Polyangiaceae bacterium]|nr:hypothetical protein [Polyangiaceae bacterium]
MRWSSAWPSALIAALGLLLISQLRAPLNESHRKVSSGPDVFALTPPEQMVILSLGYRAALADLLLGHVMVAAGRHLLEKRLFEFAPDYLDTINALDPKFREGYRFADAIITLQAVEVPVDMYHRARAVLERGVRELPNDQELWSSAGQFLAYLAPSRLETAEERAAWRLEGARFLARACELIGSNENIPHHCVTAARLFGDAGKREAERSFLERFLLMTDDPELQTLARWKLSQLDGADASRRASERARAFEGIWRAELPFLSRAAFSVLGPRFDPSACAGMAGKDRPTECATSFRDDVRLRTTD